MDYLLFLYEYDDLNAKADIVLLFNGLRKYNINLYIVTDIERINFLRRSQMEKYFTDTILMNEFVSEFERSIKETIRIGQMKIRTFIKTELSDLLTINNKLKNDNCIVHFAGHMTKDSEYQFNLYNNTKGKYEIKKTTYKEYMKMFNKENIIYINDCCYSKYPEWKTSYTWADERLILLDNDYEKKNDYNRLMLNVSQSQIHQSSIFLLTSINIEKLYSKLKEILTNKSETSLNNLLETIKNVYTSHNCYLHTN